MSDGRLLQPSKPFTPLESVLQGRIFGTSGAASGEIWTTHTHVSDRRFSYVFAAQNDPYDLKPAELMYEASTKLMVFEANSTSTVSELSADKPLGIKKSDKYDFQLYTVAPVEANGWAVLGEPDKWVSISTARVVEINSDPTGTHVFIRGAYGEIVNFAFADPKGEVKVLKCTIAETLRAHLIQPVSGDSSCQTF